MRLRLTCLGVPIVCLVGCGDPADPLLSVPARTEPPPAAMPGDQAVVRARAASYFPPPLSEKPRYGGRCCDEWCKELESEDGRTVVRAAKALKVMGADGRGHLFDGLKSSRSETRRICLETMSVAELRCFGEEGKRLLVRLCGDRQDMRIRERAMWCLSRWQGTAPSP